MEVKLNELIAKSNGYKLVDHLLNTADKCVELAMEVTDSNNALYSKLVAASYLCGLFHDLGKSTRVFQDYLNKTSDDTYSHSYMSAALFNKYIKTNFQDENIEKAVLKSILFHHPLIKNDDLVEDIVDENAMQMLDFLIETYNRKYGQEWPIEKRYNTDIFDTNGDFMVDEEYFSGSYKTRNHLFLYLQTILRFADVLDSSKLSKEQFTNIANFSNIKIEKPEAYDDRFYTQKEKAEELAKYQISCFDAQTGFGKTMTGILYILQTKKKGYWICPRRSITEGVYETVCNEIRNLGLDGKVSVSLMLEGKYIACNDETKSKDIERGDSVADITVINIDSYVRPLFNTDGNIRNFTMINSTCIFDEFHEYMTNDSLLALYETAILCRKRWCNQTKTLLLSATTEKLLMECNGASYLDDKEKAHVKVNDLPCVEKLQNRTIEVNFVDNIPNQQQNDTLVYINSVTPLQNEFIENGLTDDLIHAKFCNEHRNAKYERVTKQHGKHASENERKHSWGSTSVIGTGIDVSFNTLYILYPTPNTLLQTLGRINRWGECQAPKLYIVTQEKYVKNEIRVIEQTYNMQLQAVFAQYMKDNLGGGVHTMRELYNICEKFKEQNFDFFKNKVFKKLQPKSYEHLSKLKYKYSNKNAKKDGDGVTLSNAVSLRSLDTNKIFMTIPGTNMTSPMQIDLNDYFLQTKDIDNMLKEIRDLYEDNTKYFNKYQMKSLKRKADGDFKEYVLKKAKSSNTPLLISVRYYGYDEIIGLFKKH